MIIMAMIQTIALLVTGTIHLLVTPYTKVEESFGIQALHDFLFLSNPLPAPNVSPQEEWDHENFPGVVHRTFLVNFFIYLMAKPLQLFIITDKFTNQILSRFCLLTLFCYGYYRFCQSIIDSSSDGKRITMLTTLLAITQFHLPFYASRTLPNTFALIFVLLAYADWIRAKWKRFLFIVAFTVLIIRFETIILFGCIILYECFYSKNLSMANVFLYGIPSGIISLMVTILFDSYMWKKLIWPEGDTIWFNIFQNKSHLWGTQPFFWYFYHALPNVYLVFTPLLPLALFNGDKMEFLSIAFIFLYSFLPHKELRFIIYTIPLLNLSLARIIFKIYEFIKKLSVPGISKLPKLFLGFLTGIFLLNTALTGLKLYVSYHNYPGGNAIALVNEDILYRREWETRNTSVYVCDLAAQSGFTRFLELDNIYYNKDPKFDPERFKKNEVIYLVVEPKEQDQYLSQCTDRRCSILYSIMTLEPKTILNFKISLNIIHCELPPIAV